MKPRKHWWLVITKKDFYSDLDGEYTRRAGSIMTYCYTREEARNYATHMNDCEVVKVGKAK